MEKLERKRLHVFRHINLSGYFLTFEQDINLMLDKIKKMLGMGPETNFADLVMNGAQIIDVRTPAEFAQGHIKGSLNIPLQQLPDHLSKISKDKPVITCCASGMRSASAKGILLSKGYKEVHNGGGWQSLQRKMN